MLRYKSKEESIKGYGKSKLSKSETNDCVVCSIASAFDITYNQSHKFCKDVYGRKNKIGVMTYIYHSKNKEFSKNEVELFGKKIIEVGDKCEITGDISPHTYYKKKGFRYGRSMGKSNNNIIHYTKQCRMTIGTFIKKYTKGTFILSVSGHSFTVKDGSVIGNRQDSRKLRVRVEKAWEVIL